MRRWRGLATGPVRARAQAMEPGTGLAKERERVPATGKATVRAMVREKERAMARERPQGRAKSRRRRLRRR